MRCKTLLLAPCLVPLACLPWLAGACISAPRGESRNNARPEHAAAPDGMDQLVQRELMRQLSRDPVLRTAPIDVQVREGVATLSGTVDNLFAKQRAAELAGTVPGVRDVVDGIQLVVPRVTDEEIQRQIQERLPFKDVAVQVTHGVVAVSGVVEDARSKEVVSTVAQQVPGVRDVDVKQVMVASQGDRIPPGSAGEAGGQAAPQETLRSIRQALSADPRVDGYGIQVDYRSGMATLRGSVDSLSAREAAEEIVRRVPGVGEVRNQIAVQTATESPDVNVERQVLEVLLQDPYLQGQDIRVRVQDGTVYLEGTVGAEYQRTRARDLVSRIRGVVHVYDQLRVVPPPAPPDGAAEP